MLTKHEKEWKNVCYNLKDQGSEGSDDGDDDDEEEQANGRNGSKAVVELPGAITTRRMRDKGNM